MSWKNCVPSPTSPVPPSPAPWLPWGSSCPTGLSTPLPRMVVATYDMVDAAMSIEALTAAQDTARAAHDRFIDAAATCFRAHA